MGQNKRNDGKENYTNTDGKENNARANYNIDRDAYIGDSSLYARNDGGDNARKEGRDKLLE
jgi:hypothetical protein